MKKILSLLVITGLVMSLCACNILSFKKPEEMVSVAPLTEPEVGVDITGSVAGETGDNETSANETQTVAEGQTSAEATQPVSQTSPVAETAAAPVQESSRVVGVTAKGYQIVEVNGVTYIDGIVIANKTYSLPESYAPGGLTGECSSAFNKMAAEAYDLGLTLYVSSGFRSYYTQSDLYNRYCARDGKAAADTYSARPGHSEHQTGLAIDLNTITSDFAYTSEGKWVAENCWKYGFILRYQKDKEAQTGYMYEPWHIRYVGKDIAEKIYNSGLCLEEYYGITSVYGVG